MPDRAARRDSDPCRFSRRVRAPQRWVRRSRAREGVRPVGERWGGGGGYHAPSRAARKAVTVRSEECPRAEIGQRPQRGESPTEALVNERPLRARGFVGPPKGRENGRGPRTVDARRAE